MADLGLTDGWDTVYAIKLEDVNTSIQRRPDEWPKTAVRSSSGATGRYDLNIASLSNWRVVSASGGGLLNMAVDIVAGTLTRTPTSGASEPPVSLAGLTASVQVGLAWVASPLDPTRQLQPTDLNITTLSPATLDATSDSIVKSMLRDAFAADHTKFKASLAAVDIGGKEAQGALSWLAPTTMNYATSVPPLGTTPTLTNSFLAVLAMTENRTPTNLVQQVSAFAIPDNQRAGFVIHRRLFLQKMVRPGIPVLFSGAAESDFELYNDDKGIRNIRDLNFPALHMDASAGAAARDVNPSIPARQFSLDIDGTALVLRMTNFNFEWQAGVTVKIDYEARASMAIGADGTLLLVQDSSTIDAVVETASWVDWLSVGGGVLIAIVGTAVGAAIGAAIEGVENGAAVVVDDAAAAGGRAIAMRTITTTTTDPAAASGAQATRQAATGALGDLAAANAQGGNRAAASAGFMARNWIKIKAALIGGVPSALVGGVIAVVPIILRSIAEGQSENLPKLDTFATTAVGPVRWPDQGAFKLTSITINDALQIGGDPFPL